MIPYPRSGPVGLLLLLTSFLRSMVPPATADFNVDIAPYIGPERERLMLAGGPRGASLPTDQFVHIFDWQLQRWVTFWPPGMAPPALNRSGGWRLTLGSGEEEEHTADYEGPEGAVQEEEEEGALVPLLLPSAYAAPRTAAAEWVGIPNVAHGDPSLHRSIGLQGEVVWFVVFGASAEERPEGAPADAGLWALVAQHHSTVVRSVQRLAFEAAADDDAAPPAEPAACALHLDSSAWDCVAAADGLLAADPPADSPGPEAHSLIVIGEGMEWLDDAGTTLRFVVGDHVWAMRVGAAAGGGNAVLFQMSSSPLLPAVPEVDGSATHSVPADLPPSLSHPVSTGMHQRLGLRWCTATAGVVVLVLVVIYAAVKALRASHPCRHSSSVLPTARDPGPAPPEDATPPRQWCISGRVLGRGAFGVVYEGMDPMTGQIVAVKELPLGQAAEVEAEMRLLAALKHPNIVAYLGSYVSNANLCLVMEYVPCGSLESLMKTYKYIALPALRMYALDILHGLSYLHNNRIIHRDIKPANILIGQDGMCKLADFGLSRSHCDEMNIYRSLSSSDVARTVPMGTPAYMSPEAIQGAPCMASDVWAVGLTLLQLASGRKPWSHLQASQPMALLIAIVRESEIGFRLPGWLPPPFAHFLRRCLAPCAAARAACEELLCADWLVRPNPSEAQVIPDWVGAAAPGSAPGPRADPRNDSVATIDSDTEDWLESSASCLSRAGSLGQHRSASTPDAMQACQSTSFSSSVGSPMSSVLRAQATLDSSSRSQPVHRCPLWPSPDLASAPHVPPP